MKHDAEFKAMLGNLSPIEKQTLRDSIEAEGIREPICLMARPMCPHCNIAETPNNFAGEMTGLFCGSCGEEFTPEEADGIYSDAVIIDGYNRQAIAEELGQEIPTRFIDLANRQEAKLWIARNQLGRRNLTPEKTAYCRGLLYNDTKQDHGGQTSKGSVQNVHSVKTSEAIAKDFGVNELTIRRDGNYASSVDEIETIEEGARANALDGVYTKKTVIDAARLLREGDADAARERLKWERGAREAREETQSEIDKIKESAGPDALVPHARNMLAAHGGFEGLVKALLPFIPKEEYLVQITAVVKLLRGLCVEAQKVGDQNEE